MKAIIYPGTSNGRNKLRTTKYQKTSTNLVGGTKYKNSEKIYLILF
jgi:hypothetical protein